MAEGGLYVAAVIGGRSMSATMTAQPVTNALLMAVWRRGGPDASLYHSVTLPANLRTHI
jgi:putative transposase